MKLLPLRFVPLSLAVILVITLGLISPAGNWLENTGSIFLLLILALVFPYICFVWLTTLMTPPSAATVNNSSEETGGNGARNSIKESEASQNIASNIASNIIGNITQNTAKKSSKIVDGGDDSNTIFLSLDANKQSNLLNGSAQDYKETETIPKAKSSIKKLFVDRHNQSLNGANQTTAKASEKASENISASDLSSVDTNAVDPKLKANSKSRSMRLRYRGAWLDHD
ncbi:MAG: hypothetical protein WCO45_08665 [Pseudanabaena sp. ELA607]|jgi:hypothetical protein